MKGVLEEGTEVVEETEKGSSVRDAGLITAAQRVEHYEMAGYGGVIAYAKLLGLERGGLAAAGDAGRREGCGSEATKLSQTINKQAQQEQQAA